MTTAIPSMVATPEITISQRTRATICACAGLSGSSSAIGSVMSGAQTRVETVIPAAQAGERLDVLFALPVTPNVSIAVQNSTGDVLAYIATDGSGRKILQGLPREKGIDVLIGVAVASDFLSRLAICPRPGREFLRPTTWADVAAIASFVAPIPWLKRVEVVSRA